MTSQLHYLLERGPRAAARTTGLPPIVILHGLFGSSRNWTSVAKQLAAETDVYCLDFRNHGDSPHLPSHSLADLREDLREWLSARTIARPILLGHSMGGMVAMSFALEYPDRVAALIVIDIAPRNYPPHHESEFAALSLDVSRCATRQDVDSLMSAAVPDRAVRQFLQMNLERENSAHGGYRWKINVPVLKEASFTRGLERAGTDDPVARQYAGPTLFVRGGQSDYIRDTDFDEIHARFPAAHIETVAGHGHWLHHTAAPEFVRQVRAFVETQFR
jgi:pimeloyl-ACP methyl ester carboxylesterase